MASKEDGDLLRAMRRVRTPFGRIGEKLGFRWVFWFTLPIPYHPWIAFFLPFVPLLLVGWGVALVTGAGSPPVPWWSLLLTGLLLLVPLSIPILNVFAFAFRVPLLQAFCFLGSMMLLAAEVAAGTQPPVLGLLPLGYALLFLAQRIGGPAALAGLQRDNAAFRPVAAGTQLVRLHLPGRLEQSLNDARNLMHRRGLAQVLIRSRHWLPRGRLLIQPTSEGRHHLRTLVPSRDLHQSSHGLWIDPVPLGSLEPAIEISKRVRGHWLLKGRFSVVTVDRSGERQRLAAGKVAVIGDWPLFVLFYDFALFGGGRSGSWIAGFQPGRRVTLREEGGGDLLEAALLPAEPRAEANVDELQATLQPLEAWFGRRKQALVSEGRRHRREAVAEIDALIASSRITRPLLLADFREEPELLRGTGRKLCIALAAAKEKRRQFPALVAANMLAALPLDEFVTLEEELVKLLGSRILALEWQLTPGFDTSPLPKGCPRFGSIAGFGLMSKVPDLWERLGELGPAAARITALFIKEVGERPVLVKARERFRERGVPFPAV